MYSLREVDGSLKMTMPMMNLYHNPFHHITDPEILSVRQVAEEFGELFGVKPVFINKEAPTALLNNPGHACELFGQPKTPVEQIIKWTARWLEEEKRILNKPTHFEIRDGKY